MYTHKTIDFPFGLYGCEHLPQDMSGQHYIGTLRGKYLVPRYEDNKGERRSLNEEFRN